MAVNSQTLNFDTVRSLYQDHLIPKIVDNVTNSSAFLSMLTTDGRTRMATQGNMSKAINGGDQILQPIRYDRGNAGTFKGLDVLDVT